MHKYAVFMKVITENHSHTFLQKFREIDGLAKDKESSRKVDLTKFFYSEREFFVFPHCAVGILLS